MFVRSLLLHPLIPLNIFWNVAFTFLSNLSDTFPNNPLSGLPSLVFLSGSPNKYLWNESVDVSNPSPAPKAILPKNPPAPNGPATNPAKAPIPIFGTALLTCSCIFLDIKAPDLPVTLPFSSYSISPNKYFLNPSEFLA